MTDRPDPFDDLEFETAEAVSAEEAAPEALVAATAPAKPKTEAAAAAAPATAEAASSDAAPAPAAPSKIVAYATLGLSALACAGTISAVIVTVVAAQPKPVPPSPERAAIGRIEAMLTGQQKRLDVIATESVAADQAPAPGGAELAALTAVVRANQQAIEALPAALKSQMPRSGSPIVRPVVVTKPGTASDPRVAEVLRSQAAIQRQIEALAAKMAKTTAACVTQNDGQIRYP